MEYKWIISGLECYPSLNGLTNVVSSIHWRYMGKNENGTTYLLYGQQKVDDPNIEEFIDYENLNLETISTWLESIMDMEELRSSIESGISAKENPPTIMLNLPDSEETDLLM
jgi:hypothetical protein